MVAIPLNENNDAQLLSIGKPCAYHDSVDPKHRVGKFLRSRMSIIDLIPCTYRLDFSRFMQDAVDDSGLAPEVSYEAMADYSATCKSYGLGSTSALRLYTTDDTSASDSVQNSLKDNFFQTGLNRMSEIMQPVNEMGRSAGWKDALNDKIDDLTNAAKKVGTGTFGESAAANKLINTAMEVVAKGHRISLPAIWSNSQYTPNFQAVIKLASPYGDVKSIKEFIIKPLMYLLILASPKTSDGVSYGDPYNITVKAYGLNFSPIAIISNITLRRGGNDTSFNIFRQPLSVDVSLDFQYLVNGFAHYNYERNIPEANLFHSADQFETFGNTSDVALPTIGNIVTSLRPKKPENDIDYTTYYSNMKPARDTKESTQNSGKIFAGNRPNTISPTSPASPQYIAGLPADKTMVNAAKTVADNNLVNQSIKSVTDSFQDNVNSILDDFII